MSSVLRFDGRVALITGAGGGLGRCYALAFADRGAKVVVNDLGGDPSGSGKNASAADKVVEEIRTKGGIAVANYDSVENGENLVKTAIDNFGRIDVVVNNAGILRDRSFVKMKTMDWDLIHRVHLRGSFLVTRAAWPYMRKQNFGRVIMTSSNAAVYGNFGQANYSAAKLGLVGLSNTLALEGQKYGICCNAVVPTAGSRLTQSVMPPDLVDALKPEYVAPLVLYLCHESSIANGGVYEAAAGWYGQLRWQRSDGAVLRAKETNATPEDIRDNWERLTDFSGATNPASIGEQTSYLVDVVKSIDEAHSAPSDPNTADGVMSNSEVREGAVGHQLPASDFEVTSNKIVLYNLSVGASTTQDNHLRFLYEGSDRFDAFPTFAVIPAQAVLSSLLGGQIPGLNDISPASILHGEQYLEMFKPFPSSGTIRSVAKVADVLDKGSGALILLNVDSSDSSGDKLAFNQFSIFSVGSGGFGGRRSSKHSIAVPKLPDRTADAEIAERTSVDQAALYRLNGDSNPLHIDPSFSALGGFEKPILHGLCSLGFAVRHVLASFANSDVTRFKAVKVRFLKPVLPGQALRTRMWNESKGKVIFETKVDESGLVCLVGFVQLNSVEGAKL